MVQRIEKVMQFDLMQENAAGADTAILNLLILYNLHLNTYDKFIIFLLLSCKTFVTFDLPRE